MEISGKKIIRELIQDETLNKLINKVLVLHTQTEVIELCDKYGINYEVKDKVFFNENYADRTKYKYKYAIALIEDRSELSFDSFIEKNKNRDKSLVVVVDRLQDPFNLGAMLRSCAAFGVTGVIIPKREQAPVNHYAVIKASQGYSLKVDVVVVTNLHQVILNFKKLGYWIYATDLSETSKSCRDVSFTEKTVLIVGNEGEGVSSILKKTSDYLIHIPMNKGVDSLNVSVATGILLYEITKKLQSLP